MRRLARRHHGVTRALLICGSYAAWILLFRLLILTFVTYFVMSSAGGPGGRRFEEVNEAFGGAEIGIISLAALSYVVLALALNPLASRSLWSALVSILSPARLERRFLPGFAKGSILGLGMIFAFLLSGSHRYLGFFIQSEALGFALGGVALRVLGLFALAYFEEFIFREKILRSLRPAARPLWTATFVSTLYCGIKLLQFDLGIMHLLTLFLASFLLTRRALTEDDFGWGAGYWTALLVVFNPLLSLPVLGTDFSGAFLVKYQAAAGELADSGGGTLRLLTGGAGGPLSAIALQALLILDILRPKLGLR